jgi:hypothetical protein
MSAKKPKKKGKAGKSKGRAGKRTPTPEVNDGPALPAADTELDVRRDALRQRIHSLQADLANLARRPLQEKTMADVLGMNPSQYSNLVRGKPQGKADWIAEHYEQATRLKEAMLHLRVREKLFHEGQADTAFWVSRLISTHEKLNSSDELVTFLKRRLIRRINTLFEKKQADDLPVLYSSPINFKAFTRVLQDVRDWFKQNKGERKWGYKDLVKCVVLKTMSPAFIKEMEGRGLIQPSWDDFLRSAEELAHDAGENFTPEASQDNAKWIRIGNYWKEFSPFHAFYMEGTSWREDWIHVGPWTPDVKSGILQAWEIRSVIVTDKQPKAFQTYRDALLSGMGVAGSNESTEGGAPETEGDDAADDDEDT